MWHPGCVLQAPCAVQVPHLSGLEATKASIKNRGLLGAIRIFLAGLHDRARAAVNPPAAYLRVAGTPGSNSFMELEQEELNTYFLKHPSKYAVSSRPASTPQIYETPTSTMSNE